MAAGLGSAVSVFWRSRTVFQFYYTEDYNHLSPRWNSDSGLQHENEDYICNDPRSRVETILILVCNTRITFWIIVCRSNED